MGPKKGSSNRRQWYNLNLNYRNLKGFLEVVDRKHVENRVFQFIILNFFLSWSLKTTQAQNIMTVSLIEFRTLS